MAVTVPVGMEYQKIHACILYRHEFVELHNCPTLLSVEAKLHGESKVVQRCFDDNNDNDKGDDKKLKDQSKNNSSE